MNKLSQERKVIGIVQARIGSTRLPRKLLIEMRGRPIIEHVLRRVRCAQSLSKVVLATSDQPHDSILCDIAKRLGVQFFRGPEQDVLKRFVLAGRSFAADIIVRICADNPLVAPEEIDRIVMHHLHTGAEYSFNHIPIQDNRYPDGLGAEVVNFEVMEALDLQATEPAHREHVTAYIWDHLEDFHVETIPAPAAIAGPEIKLDIDTQADLEKLKAFFELAPCDIEMWSAESIVRTYRSKVDAR